jgi:hypothetical protein
VEESAVWLWAAGDGPMPENVFGVESYLAAESAPGEVPAAETGSVFYSAGLVACLVWWCLVVCVYRDYVLPSLGILRGGVFAEKLLARHNKVFGAFLSWAVAMGGFGMGLVGLRFVGSLGEGVGMAGIAGLFWAAAGIVWALQWGVLAAAGRLTLYKEFTDRLFYLRRILFAAGSLVLTPLFLLWALDGGVVPGVVLGTIFGGGVAMVIVRTFMLFVRQRFSILLWFLYLCAIEILPPLTMIAIAYRFLV